MKPIPPSIADLALRSDVLDAMADGGWYNARSLAAKMEHGASSRELSRILIKLVRLEVLHRRIPTDGPTEYRRRVLEEHKRAKVALKMLVGFNTRFDEVRRHECRRETQCVCEVASVMPDAEWCECPEECEYFEAIPTHAKLLAAQSLSANIMHMVGDADDEVVPRKDAPRDPVKVRERERLRRQRHRDLIAAKKAGNA